MHPIPLRFLCALALIASLTFITAGAHTAGIVLLALAALMIFMAERIIHLTRLVTRTRDGTHVRQNHNWAYWRDPSHLLWLAASCALVISGIVDDGRTYLFAFAGYITFCVLALPRIHRRAWRNSGSRWTEENWSTKEGHSVRQLSIDGVSDDPHYAPRVAIRADENGIDLFIILLCSIKRWEDDRFSHPDSREILAQMRACAGDTPGKDEEDQPWRQGTRPGIAHAPNPSQLARQFASTGRLCVSPQLPPFSPAVFSCPHEGERLRLKRFLDNLDNSDR